VNKAVFLDRDGVLNVATVRDGRPYPPAALDQLQIYPDAAEALARLKRAGYRLIVVTNQPDVARGTQSRAAVEAMNSALGESLPVDEFLVCWHDDGEGCDCRKPKPGLVLAAAAAHQIDLRQSFLVGDRWRDIDCGAAAGVRTVLIDRQYRERPPMSQPDYVADSLSSAAGWILKVSNITRD
jgi:D-glycero-D-manno-heptose 1,7-bisphosphate phosphatase